MQPHLQSLQSLHPHRTGGFRLLALLLAALVVGGCAATSTEPAEEPEPIEQEQPTPRPVETPDPGPRDFAQSGGEWIPLDERGRPISRIYYFEFDRAVIAQSDLRSLQRHAEILRRNPDRSIVIEGHCDERGTREYNLALGERRANAIRSFLSSAGVSSRQIETVSYGEEQPADPGHTEAAWAKNRRGVMIYR